MHLKRLRWSSNLVVALCILLCLLVSWPVHRVGAVTTVTSATPLLPGPSNSWYPEFDAVDTLTGQFVLIEVDMAPDRRNPLLEFSRIYHSNNRALSRFGQGWQDNYERKLFDLDDQGTISLMWPSTGPVDLPPRANGRYYLGIDEYITIARQPDGRKLATDEAGTVWTFDDKGRLAAIEDRRGNSVVLSYTATDQLTSVHDAAGPGQITFQYAASGRLSGITTDMSEVPLATYGYNERYDLLTVSHGVDRKIVYGYSPISDPAIALERYRRAITRGYSIGPPSEILTAVTGSDGISLLRITYDHMRVVVKQTALQLAAGQQTTFQYDLAADGSQTTVVTRPSPPNDPSFHPTWRYLFDAHRFLTQEVNQPERHTVVTVLYGHDALHGTYVVSESVVYTPAPPGPSSSLSGVCQFTLGFQTLHDALPVAIGGCLDNEQHAPSGDALQHTQNGLLVWRKADNWTAFTNGYETWVNGPHGLQRRLNTLRFSWEANPEGLPVVE